MFHDLKELSIDASAAYRAADAAALAVPPAWPLASSVAVNPFLGQSGEPLQDVAARLARVAGAPVTLPRGWYLDRITSGEISDDDLAAALAAAPLEDRPESVPELKTAMRQPVELPQALPTIADLAAEVSGIDWPGIIADRFGHWAASCFDNGQALWAAPRGKGTYRAWRAVATRDLTPEIAGLHGFAQFVSDAPEFAKDALAKAVVRLGLSPEAMETYFHRLLVTLGGWAHYARYHHWQATLEERSDHTITELLVIRLLWEDALFAQYGAVVDERWVSVLSDYETPLVPTPVQRVDVVLQEAWERAAQRRLGKILAAPSVSLKDGRPDLQAAFCIDVRSEVFRRALESVDPGIRTMGFAGFFGLSASHRRFASDVAEHRLPVLLNPGVSSRSGGDEDRSADHSARFKARATRAWGRFKLAAVSSFAFVEATGPVYVGKLLRDALGVMGTPVPNDPAPRLEPALDLSSRIEAAETILRAMSLTDDFARLVLLAGHGANVVNNPHASGLHCGACGGYSGEVNARLLASLLNDADVREGLNRQGIAIPSDTLFVAALHDTTTDCTTLYSDDHPSTSHNSDLNRAKDWLKAAGKLAQSERALRLPQASLVKRSGAQRSRDWAEVRPEWGLAGCSAFVAAPRHRTSCKDLAGRAFLHDYEWKKDRDFGVLELIMTAPVVVASWISLQYYGSAVAPDIFGGGNKLLHNVVGGVGVVEGNGGVMRAGLPWQSVHDGESFAHEPLRLTVCIEAPRQAMSEILKRHDDVRALFDNRWLHLFALDEAGQMSWRYGGDLQWVAVDGNSVPELQLEVAV